MESHLLRTLLPGYPLELYSFLEEKGEYASLPAGLVILKEGKYVNNIPLVISGLLKVTKKEDDKEILLYYIKEGESCIMSFSACIANSTSSIYAITEMPTEVLLVSRDILQELLNNYPSFNNFFHNLYHNRYNELIGTINQLVFKKFDERLLQYLIQKSKNLETMELHITHQKIAQDTGTIREVVSRTLKKIEKEGKIELTRNSIKLL